MLQKNTQWVDPGLIQLAPTKDELIVRVCDKMLDYMEEHGWRQNRMGRHGGPRCTVGMIYSAASELGYYNSEGEWVGKNQVANVVIRAFSRELKDRGYPGSIPRWNDSSWRGQYEVRSLIKSVRREHK